MTLPPDQLMTENQEYEFHKFWDKLCDDGYKNAYECARKAWLASRESLVVELPSEWLSNHDSVTPDLNKWYRADLVRKRLNSAGINYREKE